MSEAVFNSTESRFRFIANPDSDSLANRTVWIRGRGRVWRHYCLFTLATLVWRHSTAKHFRFRWWIRLKTGFANSDSCTEWTVSLNRIPVRQIEYGLSVTNFVYTFTYREISREIGISQSMNLPLCLYAAVSAVRMFHWRMHSRWVTYSFFLICTRWTRTVFRHWRLLISVSPSVLAFYAMRLKKRNHFSLINIC